MAQITPWNFLLHWNTLVMLFNKKYWCLKIKQVYQTCTLPRPDSNPGRPRELVQNRVAMSRCTNWPPKLSTNMVIDHFTLNIQPCMIHFCVRSKILVKMIHQSYIKRKSISRYMAIFWIPRYWRKLYKRRGVQMFQIEIKIKMPKCKTLSLVY